MRRACVLIAAAVFVAAASGSVRADRSAIQAPGPRPADAASTPARSVPPTTASSVNQRELVQTYCVTCHSERAKTGGLVLENLDPQNTAANAETWEKVVRKVRGGMMPPQ